MLPALARRGAAAALLLAAPAVHAQQTYTLDFDLGLANGTTIAATYGDVANVVDVSYRARSGFGNASLVGSQSAQYWLGDYNDLRGVAYVNSSARVGEIVLEGLARNASFSFLGAAVGSYANATTTVALHVYDFGWNLLWSGTGATLGSTTHATFGPGGSAMDGLIVQWARLDAQGNPSEAYNTGIDDLRFRVDAAVSNVPEPSTVVLAATGLLAIAGIARRRGPA